MPFCLERLGHISILTQRLRFSVSCLFHMFMVIVGMIRKGRLGTKTFIHPEMTNSGGVVWGMKFLQNTCFNENFLCFVFAKCIGFSFCRQRVLGKAL